VTGTHHGLVHPSGVQLPQPPQILLADKDLGLKSVHGVGAGCLLLQTAGLTTYSVVYKLRYILTLEVLAMLAWDIQMVR